MIVAGLLASLALSGCSSGKSTSAVKPVKPPDTQQNPASREKALQHFIDASLFEMRGDYAKAILEYQDALRYEKDHAIYFALTKCYSALNKHSLAIEAGAQAVRLAPDNLDYRRILADAYIAAHELDAAAFQYEEIVKRDSTSIESWYALARLSQTRKPLRAVEVYQSILRRFGHEWDVLLQLAELYNSMGEHRKSAEALQDMLRIDPSNQELRKTIAQTWVRAGEPDTALAVLNALLLLNPNNVEYLSETAGIYLQKKEYGRAAELFDPILQRDSINLDTKLRIGELYFTQINTDSGLTPVARRMFESIIAHHPEDWRAFWFLGAIGAVTGDDSLAVANFRVVTNLATWNADGWVYLSSIFMENNEYEEMVTVLESALRVLPDDFRVNFFLGVAYARLNRISDAIRILENARLLNPTDVNAIIQLALAYDGLERHEESDRLYEEVLTIEPDNHLALNNYSYSLAERNIQIQRALAMAGKAVEAQPENASYLDTIGWIYFRLGKYEKAEEYLKKAIGKGSPSAVLYEHLGDVYFMMNERVRALEHWNAALRLDETNEDLREKVARGTL